MDTVYGHLKSENSQDYAQKPQNKKLYVGFWADSWLTKIAFKVVTVRGKASIVDAQLILQYTLQCHGFET